MLHVRDGWGPRRALAHPAALPLAGPLKSLRRWAHGLSPVRSASDARARLPVPRGSVPLAGPGAERARWGGPRGRSLFNPGLRRPRLASLRPHLLLSVKVGAPAPPRVKPYRAPRYRQAAYCDSDKGVRPVSHSQRASPGTAAPLGNTSRLHGGHRSPHAPGPSRRDGAPAPGYGCPRPAACQGQALPACGAGSLAAARGPAAVRFVC